MSTRSSAATQNGLELIALGFAAIVASAVGYYLVLRLTAASWKRAAQRFAASPDEDLARTAYASTTAKLVLLEQGVPLLLVLAILAFWYFTHGPEITLVLFFFVLAWRPVLAIFDAARCLGGSRFPSAARRRVEAARRALETD